MHVEGDFDGWVKSRGKPSRLRSLGAPLVRRWERALGASGQIVRIDREGLAVPTELDDGPLAIVESRWDAAAGTLTRSAADRPCEGYGHEDPPPLEKRRPIDRISRTNESGPARSPGESCYRPSYWSSR